MNELMKLSLEYDDTPTEEEALYDLLCDINKFKHEYLETKEETLLVTIKEEIVNIENIFGKSITPIEVLVNPDVDLTVDLYYGRIKQDYIKNCDGSKCKECKECKEC